MAEKPIEGTGSSGPGQVKVGGRLFEFLTRQSDRTESGIDGKVEPVGTGAGNVDAGTTERIADPAAVTEKRRRGRPALSPEERAARAAEAGTGKKAPVQKAVTPPRELTKEAIDFWSASFYSFHLAAAFYLQSDKIALSEEQSRKLGEASANVARFYAPKLVDPKTAALLGLAQVAVPIYGSMLWELAKQPKAPKGPLQQARPNQPERPNSGMH